MDAAPPLVQEAVMSPATEQAVEEIGNQYGLHIDVVGLLMKLTSYMLVGYVGPEEFLREMRDMGGIPEAQARQIIADINKRIFIPLRERMMGGTNARPATPAPVAPARPAPPPIPPQARTPGVPGTPGVQRQAPSSQTEQKPPQPAPAPQPSFAYTPPTQTSKHFELKNLIPRPQPKAPTPATPAAPVVPAPEKVKEVEQASLMRRLLSDHEEPHTDLDKNSVPPNLPGAIPPSVPLPTQPKPFVPPTPAPPPQVRTPGVPGTPGVQHQAAPMPPAPSASSRSYSVDPYREPIDEQER